MEFASRSSGGGRTFWRNSSGSNQPQGRPPAQPSSWNGPAKPFYGKPAARYHHRGPATHRVTYHRNNRPLYMNRPHHGYRNGNQRTYSDRNTDYSWKRSNDDRAHSSNGERQHSSSRWVAPLRARENESARYRSSGVRRQRSPSPRAPPPPAAVVDSPSKRSRTEPADKENGLVSSRFYGRGAVEMAQPLYGGRAAVATTRRSPDLQSPDRKRQQQTDPLYVGLPNYGNSCYQNATLQALLGLRPFVLENVAAALSASDPTCPTLRALARLMVLREQARRGPVSAQVNALRDVFAAMDPAFSGTQMQDANEFLLRLLDTVQEEEAAIGDALHRPVRDSFQYETLESYRCASCDRAAQRRQLNTSWFVNVPRRPAHAAPPSLQDALRLSMRPDRRELTCQHCGHGHCTVNTRISRLPRVLVLQLNRYVYLSEQAHKIRASVQIPRLISLNEYVTEDVTPPTEWTSHSLPDDYQSLVSSDVADSDSPPAHQSTEDVSPGHSPQSKSESRKNEPSTPTKNEPSTPTKNEPSTPTKNEPSTPTKNEPSTPTKNEPSTPTKNGPSMHIKNEHFTNGRSSPLQYGHSNRHSSSQNGHSSPSQNGHSSPSQNGRSNGHSSPSQNGHSNGHNSPSQNGLSSPSQNGHSNGLSSPSQNGHSSQSQNGHSNRHSSPSQNGHSDGHSSPSQNGHSDGRSSPSQNGPSSQSQNGHSNGHSSPSQNGHSDGRSSPSQNGHSSPSQDGHSTPTKNNFSPVSKDEHTTPARNGDTLCRDEPSVENPLCVDIGGSDEQSALDIAAGSQDEDQQLQEAIRRSLEEQQAADPDTERLSQYCVEDDASRCSVDLAGNDTYRLVAVVSHYGSATHTGHYVSDVYSLPRSRWFHYDDRRVSTVEEKEVIGESHQRNGYIFFYMHKDVCSQVASVELSS